MTTTRKGGRRQGRCWCRATRSRRYSRQASLWNANQVLLHHGGCQNSKLLVSFCCGIKICVDCCRCCCCCCEEVFFVLYRGDTFTKGKTLLLCESCCWCWRLIWLLLTTVVMSLIFWNGKIFLSKGGVDDCPKIKVSAPLTAQQYVNKSTSRGLFTRQKDTSSIDQSAGVEVRGKRFQENCTNQNEMLMSQRKITNSNVLNYTI